MQRGEVYYLRYDGSYGSEMATGRPVLIISSDEGNESSPIVSVAFLTTKPKKLGIAVPVNTGRNKSWVLCN